MSRSRAAALAGAVLGVLLVASCPRPPTGGGGAGTGAGTAARAPDAGAEGPAGPAAGGRPLFDPDGLPCASHGCAYHAGADGYFACTSGGAGACFHYGAPCAPADGCMYAAADRRYRTCTSIVEGRCAAWGAACTPAGGCMVDPRDGVHRACEAAADGACTRWGAPCNPAAAAGQ